MDQAGRGVEDGLGETIGWPRDRGEPSLRPGSFFLLAFDLVCVALEFLCVFVCV